MWIWISLVSPVWKKKHPTVLDVNLDLPCVSRLKKKNPTVLDVNLDLPCVSRLKKNTSYSTRCESGSPLCLPSEKNNILQY